MAELDEDTKRLHELGYAQELDREMGTFSNFAISFSIISILAGGVTGFSLGMNAGGPRTIMISWVVVGLMALAVGASMGEICSTYPTAGGLYYWSAKLSQGKSQIASFYTGWFNLIGQIGVIASVDFALAKMTTFFIATFTDSVSPFNKWHVYLTFAIILVLHGTLNTFGVSLVKLLGDISVWWHIAGVAVIFGVLFFAPDNREGLGILTEGANRTGWVGSGTSTIYVAVLGILLAQYTLTGFDASAHVSEETTNAGISAPKGIVRSIYVSAIAAFILNMAILQAFPKGALGVTGDQMATSGVSVYDAVAMNGINASSTLFLISGGRMLGRLMIFICIIGQFFCGMASVTANSRMIYAFSRDKGIPGSAIWHKINPKTRTPTNSVWLGVVLSAIVGALSLIQVGGNEVAFFALTGICVVGLYISYVIPVFLRLRNKNFEQGAWNLGKWSKPIGWISVAWVGFITVLFFAPVYWPFNKTSGSSTFPSATFGNPSTITSGTQPTTSDVEFFNVNNINFAGLIIIGSAVLLGIWWMVSAKNWFKGPQVQGTPEELAAIERELSEFV